MIEAIKQFLLSYKKKTVELRQLQEEFQALEYQTLASCVQTLMDDGILIGGKERNQLLPPLPKKYKVVTVKFQGDYYERVRTLQLKRHPLISLDAYYKLGEEALQKDWPWIVKLEGYLSKRDVEQDRARGIPLPEASYHMVGNEKWLEELGGEKLLKRLGLRLEQLGLHAVPEPLMVAVHPELYHAAKHQHLIIENKTPFHAALQNFHLQNRFSTLIFGRGKMISSSIQRFYQQTGLSPELQHDFYYFGDLDYEGLRIWHSLAKVWPVVPEVYMYRQLLDKPHGPGKEHHRPQLDVLESFCAPFTEEESRNIREMLTAGHYLPQEAVTSQEWECFWRGGRA